MKQQHKIFLVIVISLFALSFSIYQYIKEFQFDFATAVGTKPANGHLWSEMECDSVGLCVKDGKVGVGTEPIAASKKLEVNGDIKGTDVCSDSVCLNSLSSDFNTLVNPELYNHAVTGRHALDCIGVNGDVSNISGVPICQISGTSCPALWTANGYNATSPRTCGDSCYGYVTTSSHPFGPGSIESLSYSYGNVCSCSTGCYTSTGTCYAVVSSVGCY